MAQKDDTIPDELRIVIQRMINAHEPEAAIASVIRAHRDGTLKLDSTDIPSTGPSKEPYGPKKRDEYTGPDTWWGGFGQSMKQGGEGYNRMTDSFKGFDKGAILDIPQTLWEGAKLGGRLATGQETYIDLGRNIWEGLKRVPDALRHSGDNPENAEAWGRGLGQIFGQPAVMEGVHEYGPPVIRAASKPISKVGDVLHEYQPLSGFLPKSLSMRSLRNFERFTGGALQKIGEKAADFGLTPAQINAKALEDWNRFTSDQSGGSREPGPTITTPKPDIWDTMLGENRPKTSEEILAEWERLTGDQKGGSKETKPTFRKPDKDIWDTLLMEERTPEPPKTSPLGTAMTQQFNQRINPGQTISPEQSGLGPIERGQGQLPFDSSNPPSGPRAGGGQGELGIEPPPEWLKSQAEIEALQARLRELLEKNPNIGNEPPPSTENPSIENPSTEAGPRRIQLEGLSKEKIKALKRDGYLFEADASGKGWMTRAPTTAEMVEEAQSSPRNEKKGKKGGKEPGPETSKDEFVPSEDWKQTYTNLRNMLGRDPSAAEIEAAQARAVKPGESTGDVRPFPPKFDDPSREWYQLPDGRIIPVDSTATKGVKSFDYPLKDGTMVKATRIEQPDIEPHGMYGPEYKNQPKNAPTNKPPEGETHWEGTTKGDNPQFQPGDLVRHKEYGVGRIMPENLQDMSVQELDNYHNKLKTNPHPTDRTGDTAAIKAVEDEFARRRQSSTPYDNPPAETPEEGALRDQHTTELEKRLSKPVPFDIHDPANEISPSGDVSEIRRRSVLGPRAVHPSDTPVPPQMGQQELPWSRGENPQPIDADEIGRIRSAAAQRLMSAPHDIGPVQQSMMPDFGDAEIQNYLKNEDARPPEMNDIRPSHSPDKISFMQKLKDMLDQEEYA